MRFFVSSKRTSRNMASSMAVAIALLTGAALVSGAIAEPAHAQRSRDRDRDNDEDRPVYSSEFREAFAPLQEAVNAQDGSAAGVVGEFPALLALSVSPDEKNAAGGLVYNAGAQTNDQGLQLQGMALMLESGKVAPEQVARFNFIAYQLANVRGEYERSRGYLQTAIDLGFTTDTITIPDLQITLAESYFTEQRLVEGLNYLTATISGMEAQGQEVQESWYRRGWTIAYNNEVVPQVYELSAKWVAAYPSSSNWRDAINITRNLNTFSDNQMLDLLRLSRRVGALQERFEYTDYVDAADARRLPNEVKLVIEQAYAANAVSADDIFISDALEIATGRIEADQADLPALESDARAADAGLRTVVAAGDAFLSYDDYAKAEEFYIRALDMPGADREIVLTRLGITQVEQGKFDEARSTFGQVTGARSLIAGLWTVYVDVQESQSVPSSETQSPPDALEQSVTTPT